MKQPNDEETNYSKNLYEIERSRLEIEGEFARRALFIIRGIGLVVLLACGWWLFRG